MKREFRLTTNARIRKRNGDKPGLEGYAAVFSQLSVDLGWFREVIQPGAFSACLASSPPPDVRALFNHNPSAILGRTVAGTLRLKEDETGLHFDNDLPDTTVARDLLTSIDRGDISQCSFGFVVTRQKWSEEKDRDGNDLLIREIHGADVFDVSPVTFPAYTGTSVDARSLWPDGEPDSLVRFAKVFGRGMTRQDDEDDECEDDCESCRAGDCSECSNPDCDDENCEGCPNQEDNSARCVRRGAVAFSKTPASDSDSWDGDAARGRLAKWASSDGSGDKDAVSWSKYARGFGWLDSDNKDNFGGYKLPHHDVKDGKLVSVWGGVRSAMSALLGGRGGTSIPDGDRRAVYGHLAQEYKVHDKEPPDFHSVRVATDAEIEIMRMRARLASVA